MTGSRRRAGLRVATRTARSIVNHSQRRGKVGTALISTALRRAGVNREPAKWAVLQLAARSFIATVIGRRTCLNPFNPLASIKEHYITVW